MSVLYFFIGTKAQTIKVLPVVKEAKRRGLRHRVVLSGQHEETLSEIFKDFGVAEDYTLLCRVGDVTTVWRMLSWSVSLLYSALISKRYVFKEGGIMVVHGDTVSTVWGALIGRILGLQVAHVEAGLRSYDIFNPFPEELNRMITSRLAHIHFCPGKAACANIRQGQAVDTGLNTVYDALMLAVEGHSKPPAGLPEEYSVCSIHRFENIFSRKRLDAIVSQVCQASQRLPVVFIMHLPTILRLRKYGLMAKLEGERRIILQPRKPYFEFMRVMKGAQYVMTDGGSNQQECYYLGKPCIVFRDTTEQLEGLGQNMVLSMLDPAVLGGFLDSYAGYRRPPVQVAQSPSKIIVDCLETGLSGSS